MSVGGNLEELQKLAADLRQSADQFQQVRGTLDRAVQSVTWTGPAATRFRQEWSGFAPSLGRMQEALQAAAREVDSRRSALDQATR